jgi:hypothetical protein
MIKRALVLMATAALPCFALAVPAHADEICNGTQSTLEFCFEVDPTGAPSIDPTGSSFDDCIVILSGPCYPVSVPIPTVSGGSGSPLLDIDCRGDIGEILFDDSVC